MKKVTAVITALIFALMPNLALAAAGDVSTSYATHTVAKATFVAFTSTGTTAAFDVGLATPNNHTVEVVVTGSPATCTINLQGTINGTNYADLSGDQTCTSTVVFHVGSKPVDSIKVNLSVLSGGTSPTVTVTYLGVK